METNTVDNLQDNVTNVRKLWYTQTSIRQPNDELYQAMEWNDPRITGRSKQSAK